MNQASDADGAILSVRDLAFGYSQRTVFHAWSADAACGITWIKGRNGSGKSTLLRLIAGALPPLAGTLKVRGIDAMASPLAYRTEVFWCGPDAIAFDHLRVTEYIGFLRSLYPRLDVPAWQRQVQGLGLVDVLQQRLSSLSTGTQRKVWLSAALAVETAVVLLDEPLNALDGASHDHLLRELGRVGEQRRQAWVVASHESLGEAGEQARVLDLDVLASSGAP
jgi:ABC-type multidrug transport system ATPase subunit